MNDKLKRKMYQPPHMERTETELKEIFALSLVPEGEGEDFELEEND